MAISNPDSPSCSSRQLLQIKSKRWALFAFIALPPTVTTFLFIAPIWQTVISLGTTAFMLTALAFGLLLAVGPVAVVVCGLTALFLRVEACFSEPSTRHTLFDQVFIGIGLVVSAAPAIGVMIVPIKAVMHGYIAFRGPGQQYALTEDPYGFWQATAFWLMGAATLAFLAGVYWRPRLQRRRPPTTT